MIFRQLAIRVRYFLATDTSEFEISLHRLPLLARVASALPGARQVFLPVAITAHSKFLRPFNLNLFAFIIAIVFADYANRESSVLKRAAQTVVDFAKLGVYCYLPNT